jgi:hypothetical protein
LKKSFKVGQTVYASVHYLLEQWEQVKLAEEEKVLRQENSRSLPQLSIDKLREIQISSAPDRK